MNADKEAIVEMLAAACDQVEGLDGNEDALQKAMNHIEEAIDIILKYAVE